MALQIPFANTGDRKPISQGSSADGSVSWEKGFTSLYALAPQDGGKFIDRQEFNQIVYEISEATIENSQATAELIDDEAISTAKTWSSNKVSTELGKKGGFNKQVKLTSSGNFTAPVTGWYKITCIGGGGGGGAAAFSSVNTDVNGGAGGGSGGMSVDFQKLTQGSSYSYIIGAGGSKGIANGASATNGGDTIFNGSSVITAGGGKYGGSGGGGSLNVGGTGSFLNGFSGGQGELLRLTTSTEIRGIISGGNGGGNGGGFGGNSNNYGLAYINGGDGNANTGGGGGGGASSGADSSLIGNGGNGGSGVIFIEYFDESEE